MEANKLIGQYINGNYTVEIYNDGTKIRETQEDDFVSSFPECIDLKITNYCDMGCAYCHEDSNTQGQHGDILNAEFINSLRPFTELALGGGNVLAHPNLVEFLKILKNKNIIANITVNQHHFMKSQTVIQALVQKELVKGVGVSLVTPSKEFIKTVKQYKNAVIHVINGIVSKEDLEALYDNDLKILILGYKEFRRGKDYYCKEVEQCKSDTYENICDIIKGFQVVSFDNLAIRQLKLRRIFTKSNWEEFYMGDDGQFTMYIDLVNEKFANNSTSVERYDILPTIDEMFKTVKEAK